MNWYVVSIDIDDQMRLYRDIEDRERKTRRPIDSDIIGIVIWDLDGRVIDANDAFLRMVRYEREDLQAGLGWFDITPPEWQEVHAREEAEELARTGRDSDPREFSDECSGEIVFAEAPADAFRPADLAEMVDEHGNGRPVDLVVIDYADKMIPNDRLNGNSNDYEKLKKVFVAIDAIAKDRNFALLTASQSNRQGGRAHVIDGTHVADSHWKQALCAVMFSINAADDELQKGEARLHAIEVRGGRPAWELAIRQDLDRLNFLLGARSTATKPPAGDEWGS